MIGAQDMVPVYQAGAAVQAAPGAHARALVQPRMERALLAVLYVTILASSLAFIEPSPHDLLMGVLAFFCLIAGVKIERSAALLFLLLLVWNVAGLFALMGFFEDTRAIRYTATSFYLSFAAVLFACLFAQNTMARLAAMRPAYIASAIVATIAGIIGYFHLIPGLSASFEEYGRAAGMFKDPNVFGPFLIWPMLFVAMRILKERLTLRDTAVLALLTIGLLLSFSRGAWAHFALSAFVMFVLLLLTAPAPAERLRLMMLAAGGIVILAMFVLALLSLDSIREMFFIRAQAIQSYDVGETGRFGLQKLALSALLENFNGVGSFEFSRLHGEQQHNVYLQGFIVYGWVGGFVYILMVISSLLVGLRAVFIPTPWQPYMITAFAAFVGEVGEGFIIDSDHWRHFFLLLGMVWGLSAATGNYRRARAFGAPSRSTP